jgi:hypothetical protein
MMRFFLAALLVGCSRPEHVIAMVDAAAIRVQPADPQGLAHIDASVELFTNHGSDHVVLAGGHLTGETWNDYVQFLQLDFVDFDGALDNTGQRVALANHSVTNESLAGSCDLQLNFGVTLVSERHSGLSYSDRLPLKIECPAP